MKGGNMTTQDQERDAINNAFQQTIEGVYINFISLYAGAANDQERDTAMATFKAQILSARRIRDLAISLLPT
jgi:hypothetical protein